MMRELMSFTVVVAVVLQQGSSYHFFGRSTAPRWLLSTSHGWGPTLRITAVQATQLSRDLLPRDSFEGPPSDDVSGMKSLELLDGASPSVVLTVEELKAKWIDICIEQSRPEDMDTFSIARVLPLVVRENAFVQVLNRSAEAVEAAVLADDSAVEYITAQELERLWREAALLPMGQRANNTFDCKAALLLLRDEEDESLVGAGEALAGAGAAGAGTLDAAMHDSLARQTLALQQADAAAMAPLSLRVAADVDGTAAAVPEVDEGVEYAVTADELRRLWDERARVPFGMPAPEYSDRMALLLLDDDDEDDETEYVSALHSDPEEEERNGFWNEFTGRDGQFMRETLKAVYDDLEDMTTRRPAWKKDRHILTPDIDTQDFMGDLMWSNTYMTQRVPANWEDPEAGEMSETYLSTSTMAWPGEEETDFNVRPPAWERLNLPIGPNAAKLEAAGGEGAAPVAALEAKEEVDWENFDFAALDAGASAGADADPAVATVGDDVIDVESFFQKLGAGAADDEGGEEEGEEEDGAAGDAVANDDPKPMGRTADADTLISRNWRTPASWLAQPEFADHVGFEVWSQYPEEEFHAADDSLWDEDEWTAEAMAHVTEVTDLYLTDHGQRAVAIAERRFWEREMNRVLAGEEDCEREGIPMHLTPDLDRGVVYSDELVEMKGKMTLHPLQPAPAVLFANDTFTHNTDFETMNKIGTMREQYEWQPTVPPEQWLVEEHKLPALRPVLDFANHVAALVSTRDDVLIFEYRGQMRHIVGIRDMMLKVAADSCPAGAVKDIRLETERMIDKFDR